MKMTARENEGGSHFSDHNSTLLGYFGTILPTQNTRSKTVEKLHKRSKQLTQWAKQVYCNKEYIANF